MCEGSYEWATSVGHAVHTARGSRASAEVGRMVGSTCECIDDVLFD
jgi:hypothetical protein